MNILVDNPDAVIILEDLGIKCVSFDKANREHRLSLPALGKYVLFSIDKENNVYEYNQFYQRVLHDPRRKNNIIPVIGSYKGETNRSFLMERTDFFTIVPVSDYLNQEAILWVSECNKQYATLEHRDGRTEFIGCIREVTMDEAKQSDGWTYRPDLNKWFTTVEGNPDRVPHS